MKAQLRILADQLGVRPAGYRSPSWDVNVRTPGILKAHGFLYDSSLMGNDVPYLLETPHGPLIEVPVQWILDDAPLFRPGAGLRPLESRVRGNLPGERVLRPHLPPVRDRPRLADHAPRGADRLHQGLPGSVVHDGRGDRPLAREAAPRRPLSLPTGVGSRARRLSPRRPSPARPLAGTAGGVATLGAHHPAGALTDRCAQSSFPGEPPPSGTRRRDSGRERRASRGGGRAGRSG